MKNYEVTVYVKSVKTVSHVERVPRESLVWDSTSRSMQPGANPRVTEAHEFEEVAMHDFLLSEEQKRAVDIVREVAAKYEIEVQIVDVTRENIIRRVEQEAEGMKTFPTLVTSSGEKIEGDISKEKVDMLLSKERKT